MQLKTRVVSRDSNENVSETKLKTQISLLVPFAHSSSIFQKIISILPSQIL